MKLSTIIQNWNYGVFLGDAIESVLAQTLSPDEIIYINDGSSDNSAEIFEGYRKRLEEKAELIVINNPQRLGCVETLNIAVGACRGEFVIHISADDKQAPTYYEKALKLLEDNPDVAVIYPDIQLFDRYDELWKMPEDYETYMKTGNCISGSSMFRKKAWEEVGGFHDTQMEDYDLWLRIIKAGWKAKHLPETMIYWRRHNLGTRTEQNDIRKR